MIKTFINFVLKCVPIKWLSERHSVRDGKKIIFTERETRECHAESMYGKFISISNKYHPLNCTKRKINKTWRKYTEKKLYLLVGKITLIHAGLEREIRANLVGEFGNQYKESDDYRLSGKKLREEFEKQVKKSSVPSSDKQKIVNWCEEFRILSEDRNNVVKATYSFNDSEHKVSMVNMAKFHGMSQKIEQPEDIFGWMQDISLNKLEEIATKSEKLKRELFEINWHLFRKKIELSKWSW